MKSQDSHNNISIEMLGILSCVSDGIIVYKNYDVLYSNAEGYLLLEQTDRTLLESLQYDIKDELMHSAHMSIPGLNERRVAHCLPIQWQDTTAQVAIIKPEVEHDPLLDLDTHHDLKQQISGSRNRLDLLFNSAGDGYWDWYIPTSDVYFSSGWKQMLGYNKNEINHSFNEWVKLIHPDDLGNFLLKWTGYMENPLQVFNIEYRVQCKNNEFLWVEAHGVKEINAEGEIVRIAGFHRDISKRKKNEEKILEYQENLEKLVNQRTIELEQANDKLAQLANQDPLTQLHNRRSFDENLEKQLLLSRRNNSSLCLLLMDIDHFKAFNDEFGHQLGDECLRSVASIIKESIYRPADIAARYGGEEFVIILQDTDIRGGVKVAQNIQRNLLSIKNMPQNPVSNDSITLSIGVATNHQTEKQNLVELADQAMYAAKNNGRNQICYFAEDMQSVSFVVNAAIVE